MPVFIDAEALDFRLERLPWNAEFHSSTGRSTYAATALGESGFDHLQFAIWQSQERFVRAWRIYRFAHQPAIIHYKRIGLAQDNGALDNVLQFADIAGPRVSSQRFQRVLSDVPDILASRVAVTPNENSTSNGMSSARSRSGGTAIGKTFNQ